MVTVGRTTTVDPARRDQGGVGPPGKNNAVRCWAVVGSFFVALQLYIYLAWIASGDARPTSTGPTPVPHWMVWTIHTYEVLNLLGLGVFLHYVVFRPWRRQRRFPLDGMFCLALLACYWQDPLANYTQGMFGYNAEAINLGSWTTHIPGWQAPGYQVFAEPLLWVAPAYIYMCVGGAILGCRIMGSVRARRPSTTPVTLIAICYACMIGFDYLIELAWMRLGFYHYMGTIHAIGVFDGHYYQFPFYESLLLGGAITGWSALRFFRDDKGRTAAERGIDTLGASPRRQTTLRALAVIGAANVIYLACYNIPVQWFATHGDAAPRDITERSYFTNGLCGPGTGYMCLGPGVPIPRANSAHLDPQGHLVVPPETRLRDDG